MAHSNSEVDAKFGFLRMITARVYPDYKNSGETSNLQDTSWLLGKRNQRQLSKILSRDKRVTLL